ncbi:TIGR02391 family protein [Streptomyces sp. NPDC003480]
MADAEAEGGEQAATANLFAGAMGAYKNPASHRTVDFDDPIEAAEIIQFADLPLRQVDRANAASARQACRGRTSAGSAQPSALPWGGREGRRGPAQVTAQGRQGRGPPPGGGRGSPRSQDGTGFGQVTGS